MVISERVYRSTLRDDWCFFCACRITSDKEAVFNHSDEDGSMVEPLIMIHEGSVVYEHLARTTRLFIWMFGIKSTAALEVVSEMP